MNDHCRNLAPEVFAGEAPEPAPDGELALHSPGAVSIPARDDKAAGEGRWYGRILCGRSYCQMADLMAEAGNRLAAPGSRRQSRMMVKAMRHARLALWHAALARASLLMTILFIMFVATAVVAHETRNTVSVYENHLANPSTISES